MSFFKSYPKLLILCLCTVAAYVLYANDGLRWLDYIPKSADYIAVFIGGLMFSFGFTSPFGIGVFLEVGHRIHPLFGGLIGGVGALLSDLVIFEFLRFELFHDELHRIRSSRFVGWFHSVLHHEKFPHKLRKYLLWSIAGIIIASPLPDEFGVALVSSLTDIRARSFALLCFAVNTIGIILFLLASRSPV
jgi:uncharacterized membrane protein YdjX (TVP38/TMEM64 family)